MIPTVMFNDLIAAAANTKTTAGFWCHCGAATVGCSGQHSINRRDGDVESQRVSTD